MNRKKLYIILGAVALLIIAIIIWAAMRSNPSQQVTIRYGYLPIASDASFFVAVEKGYFSNQGIKVEPIKFETSNQALEALAAGRIDAAAPIGLEAALALEANTPGQFQIIEMTAATAQTKVHRIIVKPDSPIKTLADLRNKKIGTFPGTQMVVFLKLILGHFFDANKEVQIIELKPQLQPQALETDQVDALFCLEPTGTLLEARGLGRAISINPLYEYIQQPFPTAAGIVSTSLARERPDTVAKILAALRSAHEFIKANPVDAASTVPKYAPIDPELAPKVSLYDYWDIETIDRNSVQRLSDLYSNNGVLTKQVITNGLYINSSK